LGWEGVVHAADVLAALDVKAAVGLGECQQPVGCALVQLVGLVAVGGRGVGVAVPGVLEVDEDADEG